MHQDCIYYFKNLVLTPVSLRYNYSELKSRLAGLYLLTLIFIFSFSFIINL